MQQNDIQVMGSCELRKEKKKKKRASQRGHNIDY